jgi:formate/nitrite transporter
MYQTMPFLTHPERCTSTTASNLGKVWLVSGLGNFVGSLSLAAACSAYVFKGDPYTTWAAGVAVAKTSQPFLEVFTKAVGANWLVNVAVFMQLTSRSAGGKLATLWLPITTFVALGLEHCVANMFLVPLGIFSGADVQWSQFIFDNLVPCVLGNCVGAVMFMSVLPAYTDWYPVGAARREHIDR